MRNITWAIFIVAFILFRPYQLQSSGMLYIDDDQSYVAHATSLVFLQFPSYAKESFTVGKGVPLHSIGASLLASPFVFIFSIVDRFLGNDIVMQRNPTNVALSWTAFGFVVSSLFYLWATCLLLYLSLRFFFSSWISSLTVMLSVLVEGIPLFALRRPANAHIYEIFLQSLFIFFLFRVYKVGHILPDKWHFRYWKESALVGILIGLMFLVRLNNILIALAWPGILFFLYYPKITRKRIFQMIIISYLFIPAVFFVFQIWPIFYNLHDIRYYQGYINHPYIKENLLAIQSLDFYFRRFLHLLWGVDFGLVFSSPYLLLGLISFLWIKKDRIYKYITLALIPLIVNFYITLSYRTQGAWYGYRYLIFSLLPVIIYPLAYTFSLLAEKKLRSLFIITIAILIIPLLSMVSFEGNDSNLTLKIIDQGFGVADYGNSTYQIEIYKTIYKQPVQYLFSLFKAGPCYFAYLASLLTGFEGLPAVIYEKYSVFKMSTFIKMAIIYLFPFLLFIIYKEIERRKVDG